MQRTLKNLLWLIMGLFGAGGWAEPGPNVLTNPGFESDGGWTQWWGGNSNLSAGDPVEGDSCGGVWWHDDGIFQSAGQLEAGACEFGGKLLATGDLADQRVVIQADIDDGTNTWSQQVAIAPGEAEDLWHDKAGTFILTRPASVTIHLLLAADQGPSPSGIGLFDDIFLRQTDSPDPERHYYGAPLEPQDGVMHTAGQNVGDFNAYWDLMDPDEKPACYMTYCNLITPFVPALRDDLERYRRDYGIYLPVQLGLYIVDIEHEIAAGLWDDDIDRFCRDLNRLGYPLYIRIGYECNGAHNHYDPAAYKAAFIRITIALRAHNVEAATVFNVIQGPYTDWYPGDDYVDWMSINAFSVWNVNHPDTPVFLNDAHARGKPVMIGEAGPTWWHTDQGQASWDGYFVPYFNLIHSWPGIKNFCYINANWGGEWGDCRLQPYPLVARKYRDEMDEQLYLHGMDESGLRAAITGTTDTQPPAQVTGVTVDTANAPVALAWTAPADNTGINRYEILRGDSLAGYSRSPQFTDTDVVAGKTYLYRITPIDEGGNRGPASEPVMVVTAPAIEKVTNGEFNQGRGPWATIWNAGGLSMQSGIDSTSKLSGENSCKLDITQATGTNWHLQYHQNLDTKTGFTYALSFTAMADRNTRIIVALQETHSPYSSFISRSVQLTTEPQTFTVTGTAPDEDNVNLTFLLGGSAPRTIWIDAVSLMEHSPAPDPQNCGEVLTGNYQLPADLSGDCIVNIDDLFVLSQFWLNTNCNLTNDCGNADLRQDEIINLKDLTEICIKWLKCNHPQDTSCRPTW